MLEAWPDAPKIDRERIGLFGFSMGAIRSRRHWRNPALHNGVTGCEGNDFRACEQLRNNETPGARPMISRQAAVIVDPGPSFVFPADNLKAVTIQSSLEFGSEIGKSHVAGCCAPDPQQASIEPDTVLHRMPSISPPGPCSPEETQKFPDLRPMLQASIRVAFHKEFHAGCAPFFQSISEA